MLSLTKIKFSQGPLSGVLSLALFFVWTILIYLLEIIFPRHAIDIAEEFDSGAYRENPEKFGNHMFDVMKKDANSQQSATISSVKSKQRISMKSGQERS